MAIYNEAGEQVMVLALNVPVQNIPQNFTIQNAVFSPQAGTQAAILVNGMTYLWNGNNSSGQPVQTTPAS